MILSLVVLFWLAWLCAERGTLMESVAGIGILVLIAIALVRGACARRWRRRIRWSEDVRVVSGYEAVETLRRAGK